MAKPVIRPATLDDAALAADLTTAAYPDEPEDPLVVRYRWGHPRDGWSIARFIGELDAQPVAYLVFAHGPWDQVPDRNCDIEVHLDPARQSDEVLEFFWEWIVEKAAADGARIVNAYAAEDEPKVIEVLLRLGHELDRRSKVWQLDFEKHGKRLREEARAAREKMQSEGIELLPLADWPGQETFERLHVLNETTVQDVPVSHPIPPQSFKNFMERMGTPELRSDRFWIARHGDQPVAMSYLRFPPVRGHVWTGYTCSHPDYRGRSIARAVKLQTLDQAIELGIPFVRTDNDSENVAMLHINEMLGYDPRPAFVTFVKRVSNG
ncbi:MAG: GNAT family N-acetyltransferase [Candidatus Dormibacteraeota bacterium]|nr:GNAT family N-acetyltransferase [Candidatus Dormibacteraeota bacterium]